MSITRAQENLKCNMQSFSVVNSSEESLLFRIKF